MLYLTENLQNDLTQYLSKQPFSNTYILVDENTYNHCLPMLPQEVVEQAEIIAIPAGEENKKLPNAELIWQNFIEKEADRNTLLINLGGGMVMDLGAFAASTYKRGISYVNIPTSLLGMVDAAIGGKTGINYLDVKNIIGTFANPAAVFVDPNFLYTMPDRELLSGYAEVCKHGLIADANLWQQLQILIQKTEHIRPLHSLIFQCLEIKSAVVEADPFEKGRRKILNFGHTIGHALESLAIKKGVTLLHGEAVAAGMIMEAFLSNLINTLPKDQLQAITDYLMKLFAKYAYMEEDYSELLALMRNDKKNNRGNLRIVLLDKIGKAIYDVPCSEGEARLALDYYRNL